jgi:hypothetical protein
MFSQSLSGLVEVVMDAERRNEQRTDCNLGAEILFDDVRATCVVKDLSVTGAKLQIGQDIDPPSTFDLLIEEVPGVRQTMVCKVKWRENDYVGVIFDGR